MQDLEDLEKLLKNGFKHLFAVTGGVGLDVVEQVTTTAFL
jgi:hypothetical protein